MVLASVVGYQSADAADLARAPVMKAPAVTPMFNWSGFYAGAAGGGGWVNTAWSNAAFGTYSGKIEGSGAIAGGRLGWNWQGGNFVVGWEADFSWSNLETAPMFDCVRDCSSRSQMAQHRSWASRRHVR